MKNTFMKSFLLVIVSAMFLCSTAWAAPILLQDWNFDPDGGAAGDPLGIIQNIDEMLLSGLALKNTVLYDSTAPGTGTFDLYGTYYISGFKNGASGIGGTGINDDFELTFTITADGDYTTTGNVNYFTFNNAQMDFYVDTTVDFGTATDPGIYGGDNGTNIGSFTLVSGTGSMDYPDPIGNFPDGTLGATFEATSLTAGYWFDDGMDDLAVALANGEKIVFGLVDSNNEDLSDPNSTYTGLPLFPTGVEESEFGETGLDSTIGDTYPDVWPFVSYVSSDGSMKLSTQVVPEPSTFLLLGFGMLGIAGVGRRCGICKS